MTLTALDDIRHISRTLPFSQFKHMFGGIVESGVEELLGTTSCRSKINSKAKDGSFWRRKERRTTPTFNHCCQCKR